MTEGVVPLGTRPKDDLDGGRQPTIRISMFAKSLFDNVPWQLFVVALIAMPLLVVLAVGDCRPKFVKSIRIKGIIGAVIQIVARKT